MEKVFQKAVKSKSVQEAVLYVENTDGSFSKSFGYGERGLDDLMLCASVTKLFTTTCILKLCEEVRIALTDRLTKFFNEETLKGLHVLKGQEYSYDLTISHLLFQNSGLPDSLEDGNNEYLMEGDYDVTFEQNLERTKSETPCFAPGNEKKAHYSNINFDMLGLIIEKIEGKPLAQVYEEMIFAPMEMKQTHLVTDANDAIPYCYCKGQRFERPKTVACSGAAGGCVSTPRDLMKFSKAFWGGRLFDKAVFDKLSVYRGLQANKGPINYGGGYMQISMEGLNSMFRCRGALVGHAGSTGSFVFYYPDKDLHIVGDLTEMNNPALPIRLVMRVAMA